MLLFMTSIMKQISNRVYNASTEVAQYVQKNPTKTATAAVAIAMLAWTGHSGFSAASQNIPPAKVVTKMSTSESFAILGSDLLNLIPPLAMLLGGSYCVFPYICMKT